MRYSDSVERLNDLCCDRANAKSVRVVEGAYDRISWKAEPVMKALGPAFGRECSKSQRSISWRQTATKSGKPRLRGRTCLLGYPGTIPLKSVAIHVTFIEGLPPGFSQHLCRTRRFMLISALTPELEAEGNAREVIRRIQEMRRQLDLNVEDFICVYVVISD